MQHTIKLLGEENELGRIFAAYCPKNAFLLSAQVPVPLNLKKDDRLAWKARNWGVGGNFDGSLSFDYDGYSYGALWCETGPGDLGPWLIELSAGAPSVSFSYERREPLAALWVLRQYEHGEVTSETDMSMFEAALLPWRESLVA